MAKPQKMAFGKPSTALAQTGISTRWIFLPCLPRPHSRPVP
nr:MAG TPA: hypothetical protein [Caudoviricetes sp.]